MSRTTEPIRTCVGCGAKAPQGSLLRFHVHGGELVPGAGSGRSAYTCARRSCFERARAQRGFNRTLRMTVSVGPFLDGLYT